MNALRSARAALAAAKGVLRQAANQFDGRITSSARRHLAGHFEAEQADFGRRRNARRRG